ncbi:MAG: hypothetical protein DWI22_17930 [Planctomycetota bacterium]|nr:MAG: hypothetical protein DWI22_17930 [Planctomycetota bacterium]
MSEKAREFTDGQLNQAGRTKYSTLKTAILAVDIARNPKLQRGPELAIPYFRIRLRHPRRKWPVFTAASIAGVDLIWIETAVKHPSLSAHH